MARHVLAPVVAFVHRGVNVRKLTRLLRPLPLPFWRIRGLVWSKKAKRVSVRHVVHMMRAMCVFHADSLTPTIRRSQPSGRARVAVLLQLVRLLHRLLAVLAVLAVLCLELDALDLLRRVSGALGVPRDARDALCRPLSVLLVPLDCRFHGHFGLNCCNPCVVATVVSLVTTQRKAIEQSG